MLGDGPYTVTSKKHPLPGVDVHEYVSLAPYHWPNPDTADHLPYVRHDGVHNPEVDEYDVTTLSAFSTRAYTLAVAGYITGEKKYSDRAALLVRVFLLDPATAMKPELSHAQMIKGENEGRHAGLLDTRRLLGVVDAIGLLEQSSSWSTEDDEKAKAWFREYADWLQTSKMGHDESNAPNNHGAWYDVEVVTFQLFAGNDDAAKKVLEEAKTKRIASEIEPDGSAPKELVRTKALSYSVFNIVAMVELADLGKRVGVDLWHYQTSDGRSIRAAIDYVLPYAMGEKKWEKQQIVKFDARQLEIPLRRATEEYGDAKYVEATRKLNIESHALDETLPGTQF